VYADSFIYEDTNALSFDEVSTELCLFPFTRTFTISDHFIVTDLNVGFVAEHAYRSDIRLVLQSPEGTRVELITEFYTEVEDENANYNILLDSDVTAPLDDGDDDDTGAPYYARSVAPGNSLHAFTGERAYGQWTLEICDGGILDSGIYQRSQLQFTGTPASPPPVPNTISGRIYRDYNADGLRSRTEPGVPGLTVMAYDDTGTAVTAITDARGRYTLTIPTGVAVRLELPALPDYLQPGPAGPASATTVAFVTSPAHGVDIGVINPGQHCQDPAQTNLAVTCLIYGARTGPFQERATLVSLAEQDGSFAAITPADDPTDFGYDVPRTSEATHAQTGALWGVAYDGLRGQIYASSLVKRHAGLGSTGNPTTIYAITPYTDATVIPWFTLDPAAPDPHANPANWHEDFAVFDAVGKSGWGDLDIAEDYSALYGVDLGTRHLVIIPLQPDSTPGPVTQIDLMAHLPTNLVGTAAEQCPSTDDIRPFGLGVNDGALYVGVVCSAQSTVPAGALPIQAPTEEVDAGPRPGDTSKLRAYVLRWNNSPTTPAFTPVLNFPLNYERGCTSFNQNADCKGKFDGQWAAWVSEFPFFDFTESGPYDVSYPQPLLSNIEFYNGGMVLFFTDRFGNQTASFTSTPRGETLRHMASGGDILYACPQGEGWLIEELISGDPACGTAGQGFVSGVDRIDEYFFEDTFRARYSLHNDVSFGSGAAIPGRDTVISTVYDPIYRGEGRSPLYDGGLHWYTVSDGHYRKSVRIYDGDGDPVSEGFFMKATGLGDITALCAAAPVEIGNRVWRDENADGLQGPSEPGLAGVTVELYCPAPAASGAPLATATTDAAGHYYFSSNAGTDSAHARYGLAIPFNAACQIRIPNATGAAQQSALQGLTLTETDDATPTPGGSDRTDSDGVLAGDAAVIAITTGGPGANNHSYDFGFTPGAPVGELNLGNRVWHDADNDGWHDPDEAGLDGVTVALYSAGQTPGQSAPRATTQTSNGGFYGFEGLTAGDYRVCVTPPAAYPHSSDPTDLNDNGEDGDDNGAPLSPGGLVCSPLVTLVSGAEPLPMQDGDGPNGDLTIDFGFYAPVQVGDYVWYDHNRNGEQDPAEPGVTGVTVSLLQMSADGALVATGQNTVTDAAGRYAFGDLPPGRYAVQFALSTLPAGYVVTTANPPHVADDRDSDGATGNGQTPATPFLPSGSADWTLDLGIYQPVVQIGDYVWRDLDGDGVQDADEPGIGGVTVHLLRGDGSDTGQTATTDATGHYLFNNLPPGAYAVRFALASLPPDCTVTRPNVGDDARDSDADPLTGQTPATAVLGDGQQDRTLDLGCAPRGVVRVGDYVWDDLNGNGIQEPGEPGIGGVTVRLLRGDGSDTGQTTVTDATGRYLFADLPPGAYAVVFDQTTLPTGYRITVRDAIGSESIDSDADPAGQTAPTDALSAGQQDLTLDMGLWQPVTVGDRVWEDANGDGCQDPDERGVAGVRVRLFTATDNQPATDWNGAPVAAQRTDADGHYRFSELPPGNYYVVFDLATLPAGYRITQHQASPCGHTADSDADPMTGRSGSTGLLPSGAADHTLDLGLVAPVTVGDRVWFDTNRNGQQDPGETGVANVGVELCSVNGGAVLDLDGRAVAPQRTDASGLYRFTNLPPGDYCVHFDLTSIPPGYVVTAPNEGDDARDSDGNPGNGRTGQSGFLPANSADLTLDLGLIQPQGVRIGDYAWHDLDGDGQQGATEPGVASIAVTLLTADGAVALAQTTTDAAGFYLFPDLPPGAYAVRFELTSLPVGYRVTAPNSGRDSSDSDGDPTTGQTAPTRALSDGEQDLTLDLGLYQPACLGDTVWHDLDGDGLQDRGEPPFAGVLVTLFSADDTPLRTATTSTDGRYQFCDLPPGRYRLHFAAPTGYRPTGSQLADPDRNSDADPATGRTVLIPLRSGQNDATWDAGFVRGAALGNYIWHDRNGDGRQDANEPPLPGVTIRLYNTGGQQVATALSDEDGFYGFTGLAPGSYCLTFTPRAPFIATKVNQGGDAQLDSDAVPGCTPLTTLNAGESDLTWDAGFTLPAAVGSAVWLDRIEGGIVGVKEISERAAPGVTVVLYNDRGDEVARTTTDEQGYYLFSGLLPGSYRLEFHTLPGYNAFTTPNVGNNEGFDSDVDPQSGRTPLINLTAGENALNWFAGLIASPTALTGEREPERQHRRLYLPVLRK
jgi:subtilisin-like proprotein convertase family protein